MYKPLADEIRPESLDEVVGQQHILGPRGLLRRIVESGQIPNMIFYGPSGTGKTTVARIIARRTNRTLRKLNATTAGIADIISPLSAPTCGVSRMKTCIATAQATPIPPKRRSSVRSHCSTRAGRRRSRWRRGSRSASPPPAAGTYARP